MITLYVATVFVSAFILGKLHERTEWNKLIEDGLLLPKPRGK